MDVVRWRCVVRLTTGQRDRPLVSVSTRGRAGRGDGGVPVAAGRRTQLAALRPAVHAVRERRQRAGSSRLSAADRRHVQHWYALPLVLVTVRRRAPFSVDLEPPPF